MYFSSVAILKWLFYGVIALALSHRALGKRFLAVGLGADFTTTALNLRVSHETGLYLAHICLYLAHFCLYLTNIREPADAIFSNPQCYIGLLS